MSLGLGMDKLTMEDRVVLAQASGLMTIFEDPISFEIMDKAMMTPCGHSFSEETINNWILKKNHCPLCNKTLKKSDVLPNYALRTAIARFLTAQAHLQQNIQSALGNVSVSTEWTTPASPTADEWKTEDGVPTSSDSKLLVEVISARDLKTDWFGNTDPYCVLEFQDQRRKTSVVHRNRCPTWGEVFVFNVQNMHAESNIVITVWDRDRILKDSFIGMVTVSMAEVITTLKMVRRFVLQKKRSNSRKRIGGDILLRLQFLDLRANYELGRSTQSIASMSPISSRISTPPSLASQSSTTPHSHQPPSPIIYVQASPPPPPPPPQQDSPVLPRRAHAYPVSPAPASPSLSQRNVATLRSPPSRIAPRNSLGLNRYGLSSISSGDIASGSGSGGASGSSSAHANLDLDGAVRGSEIEGEDRVEEERQEGEGWSAIAGVNGHMDGLENVSDSRRAAVVDPVRSGSVDNVNAVIVQSEADGEREVNDEHNEIEEINNQNDNHQNNEYNDYGNFNYDINFFGDNFNNGNEEDHNNNYEDGDELNNNGERNESSNSFENFEKFENLDVDIHVDDLSNNREPLPVLSFLFDTEANFSDLPPPPPPPDDTSSDSPVSEGLYTPSFPFLSTEENRHPRRFAPNTPPPPSASSSARLTSSSDITITHFISSSEDRYTSSVPSPLSPSPSPLSPKLNANQSPSFPTSSPPRHVDFAFTSVGLSPSARKTEKPVPYPPPMPIDPPDFDFVDEPRSVEATSVSGPSTSFSGNSARFVDLKDSAEIARQMYEELHTLQFQLQQKSTPPSPNSTDLHLYDLEDDGEDSEEELTRERHRFNNNKPNSPRKNSTSQNNNPAYRPPVSPPSHFLPNHFLPNPFIPNPSLPNPSLPNPSINPLSLSSPPQLHLAHPPSPPVVVCHPLTPPTRATTKFNTAPHSTQPPTSSVSLSPLSPRAPSHARRNSSATTHNNKHAQQPSPHASPKFSTHSTTHSSAHSPVHSVHSSPTHSAHSSTHSTPNHSRNNSATNASIKNNRAGSSGRNHAAVPALALASLESNDSVPEPPAQLRVASNPAPELKVVANEDSIRSLMEMGFERDLAEFALKTCHNDMESALDKLLNNSGQLQFELLRSLLFT
jgi:hypothetical protein